MIVLFGHKNFKKFWKEKDNRKAFLGHHEKDPVIVDATDGESDMLNQMNQVFSLRGMSAGGKLLDDPTMSKFVAGGEKKKARKKFFKSPDFLRGLATITQLFVENDGDMNLAIVITQDAYDALSKEYIDTFEKLLKLQKKDKEFEDMFDRPPMFDDIDDVYDISKKADVFFRVKDLKESPEILKRVPNKKELKALSKGLKRLSEKLNDVPTF